MSSLFNSLLFDFKEIKIDNNSIDKTLQKFVEELNKKINHKSLKFEYEYVNNEKTFYLKLKIDISKYLNILRAIIEIKNDKISFNEIVWMYCLSEKFMNKIFKEGKPLLSKKNDIYFYDIMSKYYDVVDIQMDIYLNTLNKISNYHYYEIISIFNFIVLNGYYEEYIDEYMICITNIRDSNIDGYENSYRKFITIMFLFLIKDKNIEKEINDINISYDLDFYIFFYILYTYTTRFDGRNNKELKENLKIKYFTRDFTSNLDTDKINLNYKTQMNRGFMNFFVDGEKNNIFEKTPTNEKGNVFKKKYVNSKDNIKNEIIRINVNGDILTSYAMNLFQNYILYFSGYAFQNGTKSFAFFKNNSILEMKCDLDIMHPDYSHNFNFKLESNGSINFLKRKVSFNISTTLLGYYLGFFIGVNFIFSKKNYPIPLLNFFKDLVEILWKGIINYTTNKSVLNKVTRTNPKFEYSKYLLKLLECLGNIDIEILKKCIIEQNHRTSLINFINNFFSEYGKIKDDKMDLAFKILFESTEYIVSNNTFLIISYNEENKDYDFIDCIPILYRAYTNPPVFIVLGTQESTSKVTKEGIYVLAEATHYPHVLGKNLKRIGYTYDDMKESGHKIKVKDKNVRMRIFFYQPKNSNGYIKEQIKIQIKKNPPTMITKSNGSQREQINIESKLAEITNNTNSYVNSSNFSFKKLNTYFKTFYRGAIFFKMILKIDKEEQKFIFVNAHLYFDDSNQSEKKYKGREEKFIDLITKPVFNADKTHQMKINLIQLYDAGYNIFIFGDLCFKNNKLQEFLAKNTNTKPPQYAKADDINRFKKILLGNIDNNTPTTYKYNTTNYNSRKKNINNELSKSSSSSSLALVVEPSATELNKYTPDRILYALTTINPTSKQLGTYIFPYKSKHLMVSLLLELFPTTKTVVNKSSLLEIE